MLSIIPRRISSQNITQNQPSESQNQTQALDPPQRPRKEKAVEHTEIDLAQVASRQAQLEGMVEKTNQAIHTIKQLPERMVLLPTQPTPRLRSAVERMLVKQQVHKTTTRGKATSNRRLNSQQISWSQAKSTLSATTNRRRRDEVDHLDLKIGQPQVALSDLESLRGRRREESQKTRIDHPAVCSIISVKVDGRICTRI